MTPEIFIEWIKQTHGVNRTHAVDIAEELLKKHKVTIWRWLSEKQPKPCQNDTLQLMEKIIEIHELKNKIDQLEKKLKKLSLSS